MVEKESTVRKRTARHLRDEQTVMPKTYGGIGRTEGACPDELDDTGRTPDAFETAEQPGTLESMEEKTEVDDIEPDSTGPAVTACEPLRYCRRGELWYILYQNVFIYILYLNEYV